MPVVRGMEVVVKDVDEYVWLWSYLNSPFLVLAAWQLIQFLLNFWPLVYTILDIADGTKKGLKPRCGYV